MARRSDPAEDEADEAAKAEASRIWHEAQAAKNGGERRFGFSWVSTNVRPGALGSSRTTHSRLDVQVVGHVEALGWELTHVDHVFVPTQGGVTYKGTGGGMVGGYVEAFYLFRAV